MTDEEKIIAERFRELSPEAKEFLSDLESDDVELLKDGLNLIKAFKTVGRVMKLLVLFMMGLFFGVVMLWESVVKLLKLWKDTWG